MKLSNFASSIGFFRKFKSVASNISIYLVQNRQIIGISLGKVVRKVQSESQHTIIENLVKPSSVIPCSARRLKSTVCPPSAPLTEMVTCGCLHKKAPPTLNSFHRLHLNTTADGSLDLLCIVDKVVRHLLLAIPACPAPTTSVSIFSIDIFVPALTTQAIRWMKLNPESEAPV